MIKEDLIKLGLVIDNEWLDLYINLINSNTKTLKIKNETQMHHIIPRYYYISNNIKVNNSSNNLVNLYIKDHILAHYYLCRCSTNKYFGKNYASIKRILDNKYSLYDYSSFVKSLDNIDVYYKEYRQMISQSVKSEQVRNKISSSLIEFYRGVDKNSTQWKDRNKEISLKLSGRALSDEHKEKLSEIAKQRVGDKNPFYGKAFSKESINRISKNNSDIIIMNNDLVFYSFKNVTKYLKDKGLVLDKGTSVRKKIIKAINTDSEAFNAKWEIIKKERKHYELSEQSKNNIKESLSKCHGTSVIMIDLTTNNELIFNSLNKAANYVISMGWDSVHPKNISRKIKLSIENDTDVYNCKWKYN